MAMRHRARADKLVRSADAVAKVFLIIAMICVIVGLVILTLNVVVRYFASSARGPLFELFRGDSVFQLSRGVVVAIIFGGIPEVTRKKTHIRIELLPERSPPRWRKRFDVANHLVSSLILGGFAWASARYAMTTYKLDTTIGSHPPWPIWPLAAFMAICLVAGVYVSFVATIDTATTPAEDLTEAADDEVDAVKLPAGEEAL